MIVALPYHLIPRNMKNILIPTILQPDTVQAVKVALTDARPAAITLLILSNPEDTASSAHWLRSTSPQMGGVQEQILDECYELARQKQGCRLKVQYQYAVTGPLLRGLMEYLDVEMIILPESFLQSQKPINRQCVRLLRNSRYPILHLTGGAERPYFSKALYLQQSASVNRLGELLHAVDAFFNLRVVSQTAVPQEQPEMAPLYDMIHQKDIDLLVETRRPEKKIRLSRPKNPLKTQIELPLLSLYEPVG